MDSWFSVTEDEYHFFVKSEDETERSRIVVESFKPRSYFCDSKLRILNDLAYQILEFAVATNLRYASVCCLFNALSEELRIMSGIETVPSTPTKRFTAVVESCCTSNGPIPPHELKKISQFYSDRFVSVRRLLEYVVRSLPNELERVQHLEVLTPAVSGPLSEPL